MPPQPPHGSEGKSQAWCCEDCWEGEVFCEDQCEGQPWQGTEWSAQDRRSFGMVAAVAAGSYHTCAIQGNSGLLRCWGSKAHGKASVPQNLSPVYRVGGDSCQSYECNSHKLVGIVPIAQNVLCAGSPCLPEDNTFCCIPNADCSLFVSRLQFCASDELVDSANETYCHGPHVDNCNPTKCCKSVCATPPCVHASAALGLSCGKQHTCIIQAVDRRVRCFGKIGEVPKELAQARLVGQAAGEHPCAISAYDTVLWVEMTIARMAPAARLRTVRSRRS